MNIRVGNLYKAVIEDNKLSLRNGDVVEVTGFTDMGIRFLKKSTGEGSFCWGLDCFKQDFVEVPEDFSFLPHDYMDEYRRRVPKEKWLKEHGYEQKTGSMFRLRIAIVHDHKEPQYFDYWVGMDTAATMSFEELEKQDMQFWMEARSKAAALWKESKAE